MKKTKGTPRKKGSIIERVLHLAFELSLKKWKLGFSDGTKMRFKSIGARNLEQLHEEIEKAQVRFKMKGDVRILSCYEAGRDGFLVASVFVELWNRESGGGLLQH